MLGTGRVKHLYDSNGKIFGSRSENSFSIKMKFHLLLPFL